jgi:hypothetical protein
VIVQIRIINSSRLIWFLWLLFGGWTDDAATMTDNGNRIKLQGVDKRLVYK